MLKELSPLENQKKPERLYIETLLVAADTDGYFSDFWQLTLFSGKNAAETTIVVSRTQGIVFYALDSL